MSILLWWHLTPGRTTDWSIRLCLTGYESFRYILRCQEVNSNRIGACFNSLRPRWHRCDRKRKLYQDRAEGSHCLSCKILGDRDVKRRVSVQSTLTALSPTELRLRTCFLLLGMASCQTSEHYGCAMHLGVVGCGSLDHRGVLMHAGN